MNILDFLSIHHVFAIYVTSSATEERNLKLNRHRQELCFMELAALSRDNVKANYHLLKRFEECITEDTYPSLASPSNFSSSGVVNEARTL
jgi:hypothetical protein